MAGPDASLWGVILGGSGTVIAGLAAWRGARAQNDTNAREDKSAALHELETGLEFLRGEVNSLRAEVIQLRAENLALHNENMELRKQIGGSNVSQRPTPS